ncbi:hypothetical protein M5689_013556 [Euphorbia peplus]|nr:hypothetical protein M5689_013556 [Euphorbia peplus]
MAKNRNKNKKNKDGATSMDISQPSSSSSDLPQAMDTSDSVPQRTASSLPIRKVKGRPMKRSKNVRKMKAITKAISTNEKSVEKVVKHENKTTRTQSAKQLVS